MSAHTHRYIYTLVYVCVWVYVRSRIYEVPSVCRRHLRQVFALPLMNDRWIMILFGVN